jgi:hypothetical protein
VPDKSQEKKVKQKRINQTNKNKEAIAYALGFST